jgi:fluoride exporter
VGFIILHELIFFFNFALLLGNGVFLINRSGIVELMAPTNFWLTTEWRLFLITGPCGGFTTFSSFSFESVALFRQANYIYLILCILPSEVLGLLATILGSSAIK